MRFAIIGVPYTSAGTSGGEARAPSALREVGLIERLAAVHDAVDYGDVTLPSPNPERDEASGIIAPHTLVLMIDAVRARVAQAFADERVPLVVGGECPLLLGCLAAARDRFGRTGLLFVDGHEDAWPPHRSTTGEAADMALGLALGITRSPEITALAELLPLVDPADTILLGPRDLGELQADAVPSIAHHVVFMNDQSLRDSDIPAVVSRSAHRLQQMPGHWWFHVDLDVLSTGAMPAVRYPQPGGLNWEELTAVWQAALQEPGSIGIDLTIYNPELDPDRQSAHRIVAFMEEATSGLSG